MSTIGWKCACKSPRRRGRSQRRRDFESMLGVLPRPFVVDLQRSLPCIFEERNAASASPSRVWASTPGRLGAMPTLKRGLIVAGPARSVVAPAMSCNR